MARKPNYPFERMERERLKANKAAEKAAAKREQRERERIQSGDSSPPGEFDVSISAMRNFWTTWQVLWFAISLASAKFLRPAISEVFV